MACCAGFRIRSHIFPMFHVKHRKNTQLYRKVFRSELLSFGKCFTWNIFQLNAEEKIYITSGASNHISGSHLRKILTQKCFTWNNILSLAFRHEGRLDKLRQGSAPFRRSFPRPPIKPHAARSRPTPNLLFLPFSVVYSPKLIFLFPCFF